MTTTNKDPILVVVQLTLKPVEVALLMVPIVGATAKVARPALTAEIWLEPLKACAVTRP